MVMHRLSAGLIASVMVGAAGAAPTTLRILGLVPGSNHDSKGVMGISADGNIVCGWSGSRAAIWYRDGTGSFLTTLPDEVQSQANAVNSDGSAFVGISWDWGNPRACKWTNGVSGNVQLLPVIGTSTRSQSWAVSDDGLSAAGLLQNSTNLGVRWAPGVGGGFASSVNPLGATSSEAFAMNSAGTVIAGRATVSGGRAFRWISGRGSQLLPGVAPFGGSSVYGMNPAGTVLVGNVGYNIARWIGDSEPELIGSPRFSESWANACNANGNVLIGSGRGGAYGSAALIWTPSAGVLVLDELLSARGFDAGNFHFGEGVGVSADGRTLVGTSGSPGGGGGRGFILYLGDCPADMNADLIVDFFDYLDYVAAFSVGDAVADRDGDGVVDLFDYLDFVEAFGTGCE